MAPDEATPDYWLGERGEYVVTDFDGQLRACWVTGRVELPESAKQPFGRRYLLMRVDPPLRMAPPLPPLPGDEAEEIVVTERYQGENLDNLMGRRESHAQPTASRASDPRYIYDWLIVQVHTVQDPQAFRRGDLNGAGLSMVTRGDIARTPDQLPPSKEESFARSLGLLRRFVAREGHTNVPKGHQEEGVSIGAFVNNMLSAGNLCPDWAEQLEAVPGWKWLPGDDIFLMDRYARREGHTDVPLDHVEDGRFLGLWLNYVRESHAKGGNWVLPAEDVDRLEQIPHWHW